MAKLFLITHPDVIIDPKKAIEEWQLSEKGLERARSLIGKSFWKDVSAIYSSTEPKAKTVAEMAAKKFNIPLILKEDLVEIDRSSTGFLPYEEFMETLKEFFKKPDEGCREWESARAAMKRISDCTEDIMKDYNEKNIVLVGHGAAFALLLAYLKKVEPTFDLCQDGVGFMAEIDWEGREIISGWEKY